MAGRIRKTPADYHELARKRGFKWIGPEVKFITVNTWWECSEGHRWYARYNNIRHGTGCPECANEKRRRLRAADYEALAEKVSFEWLGPEVPCITTKTRWRCPRGHSWQASFHSVRRIKACPKCSEKDAPDNDE